MLGTFIVFILVRATFQSCTSTLTWIRIGHIYNTALKTFWFPHVYICKDVFLVPYCHALMINFILLLYQLFYLHIVWSVLSFSLLRSILSFPSE